MPGDSTRQATLDGQTIAAKVSEANTASHCEKVMGVENGNRIYCDNTAKYLIDFGGKHKNETMLCCGMHIKQIVPTFDKDG